MTRALSAKRAPFSTVRRASALLTPGPTDAAVAVATARALLLAEVDARAITLGLGAARRSLVADLSSGRAPPELVTAADRANARTNADRTISERSLRRWDVSRRRSALAPIPPGASEMPAWLPIFLRFWQRPTKPSVASAMRQYCGEHPDQPLPSLRTVQRWLNQLGPLARNRGRMGPRELRRFKACRVRSIEGLEPLDVITADGHTFKAEVAHPVSGRPFRPEIVTVLDIATRRIIGWSAGLAESSWLVRDAYRHAITETGVPAIVYTDNGSGFTSAQLIGAVGMLTLLGAVARQALPYNAQARGAIEIVQRTVWGQAARELVTYVGRDMDREARAIAFKHTRRTPPQASDGTRRSLLVSWDDFLARMTGWISDYNTRPHETLGESPLQRWHALEQQGWQPVRLSAAECDDLARPRETRTVQRATVTLGTKTYFAPELEALDLHGRQVQVGYDIHDPARVWIHDLEGRRLCEALLNANTTPYFPLSAVDEARASRAREREKRLARHGDEIRAELGSVAPKPPVIRDASDIVPANREDRWWTRAVDVINRLATGDVQPEERAWLLTAATLPWFRARLHLRADGDQIRRLLTG